MFKKLFFSILAIGSFGAAALAPQWTLQTIPSAVCIIPQKTLYTKQINTSGVIQAKSCYELYLETPVIPDEVCVSVGDQVEAGQILAEIDISLTKTALEQSIPNPNYFQGLDINMEDTQDLLELYQSFISGDSALSSQTENLLNQHAAFQPEPYLHIPQQITAPIDGVVTQLELKSDQLSRTSKPLVTIADTSDFVAVVSVGESYIEDLHEGDPVVITGSGFSKTYTGFVQKIYPTAYKSTIGGETVVDVELAIEEPDQNLKPGFTIQAQITTDTEREILTVPYQSVQQDENNQEYVYVAQGSTPVRREIQTGLELVEGVEVVEGLSAEDVVLADASAAEKNRLVYLEKGW